MTEKVTQLGLHRDHSTYLYFLDGEGNVCRKPKGRNRNAAEVVVPHAVQRDSRYLYFIDRDGDISRSERVGRRPKVA